MEGPCAGYGLPRCRRPQGGAQRGAGALAAAGAGEHEADARAGEGEVVGLAAGAELRDGAQGPRADGGGMLGAHTGGGGGPGGGRAATPRLCLHMREEIEEERPVLVQLALHTLANFNSKV